MEQVSDDRITASTRFIYHLQNTERLDPLRSFTTFGELGLIISLKGSV